MPSDEPLRDLELLIRSRYGLIVIDSNEEERATTLLRLLADRLGLPLFIWSGARGLRRDGNENAVYGTTDPEQALSHIAGTSVGGLYFLSGAGTLVGNELHAERLKELARAFADRPGAVVLVEAALVLPPPLERLSATVRLPAPSTEEYGLLLDRLMRDLAVRGMNVRAELAPADRTRLLTHLTGLTLVEAEKVLTKAVVEDGRLSAADIEHVIEAKRRIVEREGVLEYYPVEESMAEVADLAGLKDWLRKRRRLIEDPAAAESFGLSFPKGVLLIGVPGCGKSLCAKAVATEWHLPLLKLDPGRLYNKYIGETEQNFRRAIKCAERLAPCVLFIDELEKAFAAGDADGGVSTRVLGSFLSWLQDRRSNVFTVATANDVTRLPPEFLRKGRFDEIFFVNLPDAGARRAIFEIHLTKRSQDASALDLAALADAADGFSGAEIEQAIVSALYTAFADGGRLTTELLLSELRATRPLSRVMAERVGALRHWARGRTVSAN